MNRFNFRLIILLFSAYFVGIQTGLSQTQYNAFHSQASVDLKVTTWNIEWLSCTTYDPTDEEKQMNNVVTVLKNMNSDIVALQEIGTSDIYATIDTIVSRLGDEWAGSILATNNSNCGQNEAIVYKKSKIQLISSSLIENGGDRYDWSSGRFPVLYNLNLLDGSNLIPIAMINIHAKAMGDETSYNRRMNASIGLKALLDSDSYNSKKIILLGDFNDYLFGTQCSSCSPNESPYKNFVDDTENYKALTADLYDPYYNSPVIDNIIISNELFESYKQNTTKRETQVAQNINNFSNTTSDHIPISANFNISAESSTGNSTCENINFSETFASSLGNFTQYSSSGSQTWNWRAIYGAVMSGYAADVNNPNEDWLISPVFDLTNKSSATLNFSHAMNFAAVEPDRTNNHTLCVSSNYNGANPELATWIQLTIPNLPLGNSWAYINSGNIVLPNHILQNNMRFAFKYKSSSSVASTWEIKDLTLKTTCVTSNIIANDTEVQNTVYVVNNHIKINNEQPESVSVYNISGNILFSAPSVSESDISISQPGVYIIRIGTKAYKVIIK